MSVRYRVPLTDGDDRELVATRLWLVGAIGVQELPDALLAWFDHRVEDVPPGGTWEAEPERDWLATWRRSIEPVRAGRVVIVPTWLRDEHEAADDDVTVWLDPAMAFGSGHHATTQLCLEALQEVLEPGASVLDVGCGTGVLAIAASLLGAGRVEAVDLDPEAVAATRSNAAANGVTLAARVGSVEPGTRPADVVLANLLTPTLHSLAGTLVGAVEPGGALVASGVAAERADGVVAALEARGGSLVAREDRDGWSVLVLRTATRGSTT